ncbi:hypothetical protein AVEN_272337-1, partial [Araneus ventricosus]
QGRDENHSSLNRGYTPGDQTSPFTLLQKLLGYSCDVTASVVLNRDNSRCQNAVVVKFNKKKPAALIVFHKPTFSLKKVNTHSWWEHQFYQPCLRANNSAETGELTSAVVEVMIIKTCAVALHASPLPTTCPPVKRLDRRLKKTAPLFLSSQLGNYVI